MAAAGDRDSACGTVISMAPSHCQSTFVLHVADDSGGAREAMGAFGEAFSARVAGDVAGGRELMDGAAS